MTVPSYTEEDVELVRSFIGGCSQCYDDDEHVRTARAVLAALSSAGRLVPPGSETQWARLNPTGAIWIASSREQAIEDLKRNEVGELVSRIVTPWSPSVPDTKEGS